MTNPTSSPHVVVIGGGVLGVSTATHLARAGASVTLLTESSISSGASGRSLSWLNSAGERSPEYHALRMAGIDRYRTLGQKLGDSRFLRFDGGLTWASPGESYAGRYQHERSIGYDSIWLRPDEIERWTPGVNATSVNPEGAIFNPGEGWVDLPSLIEHLLTEFRASGGAVHDKVGRVTVETANGRATGARTAAGVVHDADAVVLATGPWVPGALEELGVRVEDQTPISLLLTTRAVETDLRAVLNTPRVAVRPTPNGTLVLDSGWSEEEVVDLGDGSYQVNDDTIAGLLAEASAVLAGHPTLELDRYGVGPKPIPGDGEPVAGQVEEIPGLHVLFTHSGATLGLILGELVAQEIISGTPSPLLRTFRLSRFSVPAP